MKQRVLFVGRRATALPLVRDAARGSGTRCASELDVRVLASAPAGAPTGDATFRSCRRCGHGASTARLLADLPLRVARELRRSGPTRSSRRAAYEAAAALAGAHARARPAQGRSSRCTATGGRSTRLYGSPAPRCSAALADRVAAWALRRADAVRTVSPLHDGARRASWASSRRPSFPGLHGPRPVRRRRRRRCRSSRALFVGVLERVQERRRARRRLAASRAAASGRTAADRRHGHAHRRRRVARARAAGQRDVGAASSSTPEVAAALDAASVLVLPSRSEGMGRVVDRGALPRRGRSSARASAGSPTSSTDGSTACSSSPTTRRARGRARARARRPRARWSARGGARAAGERWLATPEEYAGAVRDARRARVRHRRHHAARRSRAIRRSARPSRRFARSPRASTSSSCSRSARARRLPPTSA